MPLTEPEVPEAVTLWIKQVRTRIVTRDRGIDERTANMTVLQRTQYLGLIWKQIALETAITIIAADGMGTEIVTLMSFLEEINDQLLESEKRHGTKS